MHRLHIFKPHGRVRALSWAISRAHTSDITGCMDLSHDTDRGNVRHKGRVDPCRGCRAFNLLGHDGPGLVFNHTLRQHGINVILIARQSLISTPLLLQLILLRLWPEVTELSAFQSCRPISLEKGAVTLRSVLCRPTPTTGPSFFSLALLRLSLPPPMQAYVCPPLLLQAAASHTNFFTQFATLYGGSNSILHSAASRKRTASPILHL